MLVTQSCRCCGSHFGYSFRFAYAWTLSSPTDSSHILTQSYLSLLSVTCSIFAASISFVSCLHISDNRKLPWLRNVELKSLSLLLKANVFNYNTRTWRNAFGCKTSAREIILCQNAQGRQNIKLSVSLIKLEIIIRMGQWRYRATVFSVTQQPNSGLGHLMVEVSRSHTVIHTHIYDRIPLDEWSARRSGRYLHNTQKTQESNNYALSGFRTRDPINQAAADLRLRSTNS